MHICVKAKAHTLEGRRLKQTQSGSAKSLYGSDGIPKFFDFYYFIIQLLCNPKANIMLLAGELDIFIFLITLLVTRHYFRTRSLQTSGKYVINL